METGVYALLEGFLERDGGAEEVGGPLGEDALVMFKDYLERGRGWW